MIDFDDIVMPVVFIVIIGILCGVTALVIWESMQPPTPISADNIYKYDGYFVQTNVTIEKHITDRTEFEFFIMVPITTGKSTSFIFIPVYDDYEIYKTTNGFVIAVDKDGGGVFQIGKDYRICGDVIHDAHDEHLFAIKVREVC